MKLPAAAVVAVLLAAAPAAAAPGIHAHRGGSLVAGVPTYPENTMAAFRNSAREGYVLEVDVKLTSDRVPVVIHDDSVDRTTPCTGAVSSFTRASLARCRTDVLGSPGNDLATRAVPPGEPIPTLAELLAFAKADGASLNLEIKNLPNDNDFDPTSGYANRVMDVILASGFPRQRLIVQSFYPPNLDVARTRLPGVETSLLTLGPSNEGGPSFAAANGYQFVSPQFPVSRDYVDRAHAAGRRVVPFTLNTPEQVRAGAAVGTDAIITDDPEMARRTLGLGRRDLARDADAPSIALDAPAYASDRSRTRRFRVRWRGADRGSGVGAYRLEARRQGNVPSRWRVVARSTTRTSAVFRGRLGASYAFRLRARDRFGNLSRFAYDGTVVPIDDRGRAFRYSGGWRRLRRTAAYGLGVTRARRPGASLTARFRGSRVALIARRTRRGARLLVRVDGGRSRVVSLRGRGGFRSVVYRSARLRSGQHVLRVRVLGKGVADIDAAGITTGPAPPRG